MICAWLSIKFTEDGISLTKFNLVIFFEMMELPTNERVVIWVYWSSNETSSKVCVNTKPNQILLAKRWEVFKPIIWILEFRNFLIFNTDLLQNLILCQWLWFKIFCLFFFWGIVLLTNSHIVCNLTLQSVSRSLNGHTSAMETKWEQNLLTQLSLEPWCKLTLGHWIGVS